MGFGDVLWKGKAGKESDSGEGFSELWLAMALSILGKTLSMFVGTEDRLR